VHCLRQAIVLIMSSSLTTRGHGSHHLSQPEAMARHLLQATALIIYFVVPLCPSQPEAMAHIICNNQMLPVSSLAATGRGCHHRVILSLMFSGTGSYHSSFHHLSHVALLVLIVTSSLALRDHGSSSLASQGSHHLSGRCESHFASGCQSTGIQSHIACPGILLCFTLRCNFLAFQRSCYGKSYPALRLQSRIHT